MNRAIQALLARIPEGGQKAMAAELEVSPSHLSRVLRDEKVAGLSMRRVARDRYGIPLQWWDEPPLPEAPAAAPLPPDFDEQTPAEAPAPKRLSSRPPPPTELVDAVDLDSEGTPTVVTEPPAIESAPDIPPVRLSELNVRTDTKPDPRAGDVLERTPKPLTALDVPVPERVTVLDDEERTPTPTPSGAH